MTAMAQKRSPPGPAPDVRSGLEAVRATALNMFYCSLLECRER
jgi:hypothetical protein